jgi:hypothetical protein
MIYGERYLPLNGKKYQVKGICYTISAEKRRAIYPYEHEYCSINAQYRDETGKTWFMDVLKSEGETADRLLSKMERDLNKISLASQ